MTDAEVAAMARGRGPSLAPRIARHSPSKPTGKLSDKKARPLDISAAEMRQIQRREGLAKSLRERLGEAAPSDEPAEPLSSPKESPKRQPEP
jgi:hypothetical protein